MHRTATATASASPPVTPVGGGTLYLVFSQVASRAFTFMGNQFLLRYLSPSLLGLAVQLELLSVTILYFSRESLRVALQRQPAISKKMGATASVSQQIVNLAYLAIGVGLCTSVGFGYGYLQKSSNEVLDSVDFRLAFQLYTIATFVELLAEPCFVVIQQHGLYKARARAETTAAIARCIVACISVLTMHKRGFPASVLPFAMGQLFYAGALIASYLAAVVPVTKAEAFTLLPRRLTHATADTEPSENWLRLFSKPLLSLTATFYAQSVFKLLLTQGDSLILSFLTDLKSQGAFALASNYGGLLSRLVFQPIEESSRNIFGRLLASREPSNSSSSKTDSGSPTAPSSAPKFTRIDPISGSSNSTSATSSSSFHLALTHLTTTLHLYTLLTLPLLSLFPPVLPPLTNLVLSPQWRTPTTTALLSAYLHYIPFLAVNGILDAFVTTVATPSELRSQSLVMACVTAVYGIVAWVLMGTSDKAGAIRGLVVGKEQAFGSPGLVYANMVNMMLRIGYSTWFVSRWLATQPKGGKDVVRWVWRRSLPGSSCAVVAVAVGGGLRSVLRGGVAMGEKTAIGIRGVSFEELGYVLGGAIVLGSSMLISERQFLLDNAMPLIPERLAARIRRYLPQPSGR